MLEIMIPRDIRDFETKFIGPFTFRQTIAFAIAAGFGYIGLFIQQHLMHMETVNYVAIIPFAVIPVAFGYGKQLIGMDLEIYLKIVFVSLVLLPKRRPYRTHNYYSTLVPKKEPIEKKEKPLKDVPADLVAYA